MTKVVSGFLGGGSVPKAPVIMSTPAPPPPQVQPILPTDTEAINKAKKKAATAAQSRSGRQSTIMSETADNETLG